MTGFVPMEKGFYFGYDNKKLNQFLFDSSFYKTYKTQYNLITTNAYEYYQNNNLSYELTENGFKEDEKIKNIKHKTKPIGNENFETLINKMIENKKFSEVIFSIISINNLNDFSIFLKAGLYTIV